MTGTYLQTFPHKLKNKNQFLIHHRLRISTEETTELRNNMRVLPQLIRIPRIIDGIVLPPTFYAETKLLGKATSPTLKIMMLTKNKIKTREYLPITLTCSLDSIPGLTWIPEVSLTPSRISFSLLALTNPLLFNQSISVPFKMDLTIHPEQLDIVTSLNNYRPSRTRVWNKELCQSSLTNPTPISEQADLPLKTMDESVHRTLQTITISMPIEHNTTLNRVLDQANHFPLTDPRWNNIYFRWCHNELNYYYVRQSSPSPKGITLHYGPTSFFFSRIYSVHHRRVYVKLSRYSAPYDWIPIMPPSTEFHLLTHPIPEQLHNNLSVMLPQNTTC